MPNCQEKGIRAEKTMGRVRSLELLRHFSHGVDEGHLVIIFGLEALELGIDG